MFIRLAGKIESIAKAEKRMGEMYQSYSKDLMIYVRKMRDKSKQMETLAREGGSGVNESEVKDYKRRIQSVDDKIKMIEGYYDRMKDLSMQKIGMIKRMKEYNNLVVLNSRIRKKIVDIGISIEKEKNKMVAADDMSKREDHLKDIEREFERNKKELQKKWETLEEERSEVNSMWHALKDCMGDFE